MNTAQSVLTGWPFGGAEAAHRSDLPTQRIEEQSVPSVGPNPFLSAARIMRAREEVAAL
jgi:hypothetical protein